MLKYWILIATLLYSAATMAATLEERMTQLRAVTLQAEYDTPAHVGAGFLNLHVTNVTYYVVEGDIVTANKVTAIISNYLSVDPENPEAAYWLRSLPEPLRPAPSPPVLFSARTVGAVTAANVETYCNNRWTATVQNGGAGHTTAASIREFSVTPIDGKTVQISGKFNIPEDALPWQYRSYYIRLVDADGSVQPGNVNVKFERVE